MKDAFGHGSSTRGGSQYLTPGGRGVVPSQPFRHGGEYPARNTASNEAAAQTLMSAKSSAVPAHPSMAAGRFDGTQADYTTQEYASLVKGGGVPMSSNAQAAQSLMSTLRSTQAPIHPAMVSRSPDGGSAS